MYMYIPYYLLTSIHMTVLMLFHLQDFGSCSLLVSLAILAASFRVSDQGVANLVSWKEPPSQQSAGVVGPTSMS